MVQLMRMAARPLLLVLISSCAAQSPRTSVVGAGCPPLPVLDSAGLLRDVFRLADDSMRGRRIGSPEGAKARDYLASRFDALGIETLPPGRLHPVPVTPSRRNGDIDHAFNVVGIIRGTVHPEQYIVVTAHFDHLGVGRPIAGDSIYNGADDNASGAAALVTLARHFRDAPSRQSIVFAAVDGEEQGSPGSRGFVAAPAVPLGQILVNVNLDMIGRNAKSEVYASGPGRYPQLRPLVEATAACSPVTLRLGHDMPAAGPGDDWTNQSDQEAFHRKGIPFVYFGVEDHADYHQPSDTPERLMPGFFVGVVRTVADFIRRFDDAPVARASAP